MKNNKSRSACHSHPPSLVLGASLLLAGALQPALATEPGVMQGFPPAPELRVTKAAANELESPTAFNGMVAVILDALPG